MNQSRRFTRSSLFSTASIYEQDDRNKDEGQLRAKVNQAIQYKHLNKALALLKSASQNNHWAACTRARVLFQQGSTQRALNAVRNFIQNQHIVCQICFQLLLNIIDRSRPEINKFSNDIAVCLTYDKLPIKLKNKFQLLSQEIQVQVEPRRDIQLGGSNMEFQELTAYYQNKGLIFKKVEIVEVTKEYRIARAKSTIKPHQIIIFVPEKQIITLQIAKTLKQINKLSNQQSRLKSPKHCILSIFLLLHMNKNQQSPYYNYIQCFPKKLQNFPIYFSQELLSQLQGTYFLTILKKKKMEIQQDYKSILSITPQLTTQITYDRFIWARMIVSSRTFGVVINGRKTDALVPIADMLNHKTPKLTTWYFSDEKRGFVVQNAHQEIPKGQEIFDTYGSKCNSRFLLNYGFIMPENSFNQMVILKRPRNSKILPPNIRLRMSINSDQFRIILAYYRQSIYESPEAQDDHEQQQQPRPKLANFISDSNQCQAWRMIQQTMKQQLQQYRTTIRKDQKLLRGPNELQFNYRNCVQIRLGQKKILEYYIKMAKKMIQHFSGKRTQTDINEYENYLQNLLNIGSTPPANE